MSTGLVTSETGAAGVGAPPVYYAAPPAYYYGGPYYAAPAYSYYGWYRGGCRVDGGYGRPTGCW